MMLKGKQSILFDEVPYIISSGSVVGKKEGEGPLGELFDKINMDAAGRKGDSPTGETAVIFAGTATRYRVIKGLVQDVRQTVDNYRDTTPISTFSSLATGAL